MPCGASGAAVEGSRTRVPRRAVGMRAALWAAATAGTRPPPDALVDKRLVRKIGKIDDGEDFVRSISAQPTQQPGRSGGRGDLGSAPAAAATSESGQSRRRHHGVAQRQHRELIRFTGAARYDQWPFLYAGQAATRRRGCRGVRGDGGGGRGGDAGRGRGNPGIKARSRQPTGPGCARRAGRPRGGHGSGACRIRHPCGGWTTRTAQDGSPEADE